VTDRGEPKAELGPLSVDERLRRAIADGRVRAGCGKPDLTPLRLEGRMTAAEAMAEDRAD
jgi:hypothetical protein